MEMRKNISTNMVITMGLFSREQADFVRQMMKSDGIHVTFVDLQIPDEEFLARNKARNRRKAEMMGLSMEELWNGRERMKKFGEFSEEKEIEYYRRGMVGWESLEGVEDCFIIQSSGGYQDMVDGLTAALGLRIVDSFQPREIEDINMNRWRNYKVKQV